MKLLILLVVVGGIFAHLSGCDNQTQDPALQPRNSVTITPANVGTVIMNAIAVYRAHGELPVKVADLSVSAQSGGIQIKSSSAALTCAGDGFNDESPAPIGIGDKGNAFAYRFSDCQSEVIDNQNYNVLSGFIVMKEIRGTSGACDDFSGEFVYENMELQKIRDGLPAYLLTQIDGSYSFRHVTHDLDQDEGHLCEIKKTTISGDSFGFVMNGEQVQESLFVSVDEFNTNVGTYNITLDSYVNSDSLNGRYKLVTRKPLVGLRDNQYPISGKFDLVGASVSQLTVEILSDAYDDLMAVKLDMDIDPPDGIPDASTSVYVSWCELEKGDACEILLEEDAPQ